MIGTSVQNRDVSCPSARRCAPKSSRTTASPTTRRTTQRSSSKGNSSSAGVGDGKVTDAELRDFSEELLSIDEDNVAALVTFNTGCSTRSFGKVPCYL